MKKHSNKPVQVSTDAARKGRKLVRKGPSPMALEQRFMFDGAALADAAHTLDASTRVSALDAVAKPVDTGAADKGVATVSRSAEAAAPVAEKLGGVVRAVPDAKEILFIDSGVSDIASLIADARAGVEIVVLDASRDGVQQITDALAGRTDLTAVHIVSHGNAGTITLGSTALSGATLDGYSAQLRQWGNSLSASSDLLIYGCDVAQGATGSNFVEQISQLTGADVTASIDPTGAAAQGGDWDLEKQAGSIESGLFASADALDHYDGLLAASNVTSVSISSSAGADQTYKAGDVVTATVVFSKTETVTGSPTLTLNVGGTNRTATYDAANSSGANLVFKYTIQAGDTDANGISIDLDSLVVPAGSSIKNNTTPASITFNAVTDNASHKVDTVAPTANVAGVLVDLKASSDSGASNTDNITEVSAPTVSIDLSGVTSLTAGDQIQIIDSNNAGVVVGSYTVQAADLTVATGAWNRTTQDITLNTLSVGTHSLKVQVIDAVGNSGTPSTTALAIQINDSTAPVLESASGSGTSLVLSFREIGTGFSASAIPLVGAFAVSRDGTALTVTGVSIDAAKELVTLTLGGNIGPSNTNVRVSYTPTGGAMDLQDAAGNRVTAITDRYVTTSIPVFNVNGQQLKFNNMELIGGATGMSAGDIAVFHNIRTIDGQVIDAIVTTVDTTGVTVTGYDVAGAPVDTNFFELNLNTTADNGAARFKFDFIKGGTYNAATKTGQTVILQNVALNSYDIDALNSGENQFQEFGGFATYTVSSATALNQTILASNFVHFQDTGNTNDNFSAADLVTTSKSPTSDNYRVMAVYDAISSFEIKTGVIKGGSTAYFYLDFSRGTPFGTPKTYTNPTVNPVTTSDTTPALTGTYAPTVTNSSSTTVSALTVTVGGVTYGSTNGLSYGGGTWSLPTTAAPLANGTYEVVVQTTYSDGATIRDPSSNELVINSALVPDTTPPTVTSIERLNHPAAGVSSTELAVQNSLEFKVTFSESVTRNLTTDDFVIVGPGGTGAIISGISQIDASVYSVRVSNISTSNTGSLGLDIAAGNNLADSTGNSLANLVPTTGVDETYNLGAVGDLTPPVVTASQIFSYAEKQASSYAVGTVAATDDVAVTGYRFSNGTTTSTDTFFAINATTGQITLTAAGAAASAASNDYETTPNSFTLAVQAGDAAGNWSTSTNVTVNVTNVNEAPTGTNAPFTMLQDGTKTFAAADFGFADASDSPANTLATVKISSLPTNGELRFNGVAITAAEVTAGYEVSAVDLAANKLTFVPAANANGAAYASFTFQVRDNGGTANGGVDLDQSPNTITISVTAVNDAPSFIGSGDGKVLTDVGDDVSHSVMVQPDGKIVAAGYTWNGSNSNFALVRYNADGSLDTSFGGTGKVTTAFGALDSQSRSVTMQPDGKIVVAGMAWNGSNDDFALVRYNADGSLDTGFGSGTGKVTTAVGASYDYGQSVTVQPDGKIVVAGYASNGSNDDFALVRYNTDGSLDTGFGAGTGKVTTAIGTGTDIGYSVTLQPDGKIMVAGYASNGSNNDFALVRYNADGSLDMGFGAGTGKVTTAVGASNDYGQSVTVQPDGKIVVAGYAFNGGSEDFALVRYNADGSLDTGFGAGTGKVTTAVSMTAEGYSVTVQPDGKIVVAGVAFNGITTNFALVRYNADGSLDTSFGAGTGKVTTAVGGASYAEGYSVTVQPDGKIVLAGMAWNGSDSDFALVRYNADGSLDTSFGAVNTLGGAVSFTEGGAAVVLDADVTISDAELDALGGGLGNYNGASLTMVRNGGASAQDVFSAKASGTLGALTQGAALTVGGTTIGTVTTNSGGTLVLSFNANATTALVNQAQRQIAYANSSDAPPASAQINWSFSDGNTAGAQGTGGEKFATGSVTVNITGVNDAPVSEANSYTTGPNTLLTGINLITDDGNGATAGGVDRDIEGSALSIASINGTLWASLTGGAEASHLAVNGWKQVTLSHGTLYIKANGTTEYKPTTGDSAGDTFTYKVTDGTTESNAASVTMSVQVNTVPTLADTALGMTVAEDAGVPTGVVGSLISSFTGGASDANTGALKGIAVTGTDTSKGAWYYTTNNGTNWQTVGSVSASSALLLADNASTRLYFKPNANVNGTAPAALTLKAWDQTSGTAGTKVDTTPKTALVIPTGGAPIPFPSSLTVSGLTGNLTDVNVTLGSLSHTFPADLDILLIGPQGQKVLLMSDAGVGGGINGINLTFDDAAASELGTAQLSTGTYKPSNYGPDSMESAIDSFTGVSEPFSSLLSAFNGTNPNGSWGLYINDDYAAADGGSIGSWTLTLTTASGTQSFTVNPANTGAFSAATDTVSVSITAVNDAPVATGSATLAAVAEDTTNPPGATVGSLFTARFSDSADQVSGGSSANTLAGIAITGYSPDTTKGVWQYSTNSGTNWTTLTAIAGDSTAMTLDATALLRFVPTADYNGAATSLTARLIDSSTSVTSAAIVNVSSHGAATAISDATVVLSTSITAVNDAPVNTVPDTSTTALSVAEDTSLSITDLHVTDVDVASGAVSVTLSVAHGTVTVLGTVSGGLTVAGITDNGTASVTLTGALAQINATLSGLNAVVYKGDANFNGSDTLTMLSNDGGNTGTDPGLTGTTSSETDTDTVAITVTAVNDAPVNTVPGAQSVNEDAPLAFTGVKLISVNDVDGNLASTQLTVASGTLSVSLAGGATIGAGANASATLTLSGTQAQINAALATLSYQGAPNFNGTDTLTVVSTDSSGTPLSDTDTVAITVTAVNDAPVASSSATLAAVAEDTTNPPGATVGSLFAGNFSDSADQVTGGSSANTLAGIVITGYAVDATKGVWQYSTDSGISWTALTSITGDSTALTLASTASLRFVPTADYNGAATSLTARLIDSSTSVTSAATVDVSSHGAATAISDATVVLSTSITAVNDAPVNTVPDTSTTALSVAEDTNLSITDLHVTDVDVASGAVSVTLSVAHGTVTVLGTVSGGLTVAGITDNGTASVTLTGTLAQINATLAGLNAVVYKGDANFNGSDTLTMLSSDGGNTGTDPGLTGTASSETDADTVAITVTAVNDAPVNTVPGAQSVNEDAPLTFTGVKLISVNDVDGNLASTQLTVASGTLSVSLAGGATIGAGANASATLTLSGTQAQINAALATLSYQGAPNFNGTDTLTVVSTDSSGTPLSDSDTVAITVTAVNDAPVASSSATLAAVAEDTTNPPGATVGSLFAGNFSDSTDQVTGGSSANTLAGIAITGYAVDATKGVWQYSTDSGISWTALASITGDSTALTLASTASLRFVPTADYNGAATSLTARLIDSSTSVTSAATVDVSSHGAATAISDATVVLSTSITAVNDAPVNTVPDTSTTALSVAQAADLSITGLSVADIDAAGGTISVRLSVAHGTVNVLGNIFEGLSTENITGNGTASVTLTGTLAQINATLAGLNAVVYKGDAGFNGSDTLTMLSSDGGNTGAGGIKTDTDTVAITVTALNPPVLDLDGDNSSGDTGNGYKTSYTENGAGVAIVDADSTLSDSDSANMASATVKLTNAKAGDTLTIGTLPTGITSVVDTSVAGEITVTLSGTATKADYQAALAAVMFSNASNTPDTTDRTVTVQVSDGTKVSSSAVTTVAVTAVNDAPLFALPGDGKVTTDFGSSEESAGSVTVQPDGKLLVAGYTWNDGTSDFALARYNADGSLDTDFSGDGKVTTDFDFSDDHGSSVTVLPDGKILVAGNSNNDFALVCYNADGSLDTGFGTNGKVTTDLGSTDDSGNSVTVQPDGKILVAGNTSNGGNSHFALVRYNADGSLDTGFDGDGKVTTDFGPSDDIGYSVTVQPGGKIVVAGTRYNGGTSDFALVRYSADGSLDTNFGSAGKVTTDFSSSSDVGYSVTVQPNGKILVAGYTSNGANFDFALVRYSADGSLDTGFGGDGKVTTDFGSSDDFGYSVTVQPDGKILVAGSGNNGSDFALARYNADGSLDTSFGGAGKITTDFGSSSDNGYSVTVQADGKIVVAGTRYNGSGSDFALARYNADGSVDTSFNTVNTLGGTVNFTEGGAPVVLDADVIVTDAELDALRGGRGNYDGASLTIERTGGASAQDVFSASGSKLGALTEGASLTMGDEVIGTVTGNADGTLVLTFNSRADTELVSYALRHIAYANNSDAPPDSVQLGWTFSDGNTTGAQGTGGEKFATGSVTVNITPVNDAPTGTDATVTVLEDGTKTFTAADFGFADVKDSPANTLAAVKISTLPANGELRFNGVAITAAQIEAGYEVSAADLDAGKLTFAPAANANGAGYASFTFQVRDNGGTANGGVDLDPSANTITVNVTPVNDAPAAVADSVTLAEDSGVKVIDVLANDSDLDGDTLTVTAVTQPADGGSVAINADGTLSFTPDANFNGATSFTYTVSDGHGGNATATVTVNVTPVNDAPTGTDATVTVLEDGTKTFTAADFGFADVKDSPANTLAAVKISTLPANGELRFNGVAITAAQIEAGYEVSAADLAAGKLTFAPAANANGAGYASFTFQVRDNGGTANGGVDLDQSANTITVNVTPVNDAPAAVADSVTLAEDSGVKVIDVLANDSDLDGDTLTVTAVTQPADGGSVAINADGTLSFTPDANFNGATSFTYTVSDGHGGNATVTVTVNVTPVNDVPVNNAPVNTVPDTSVKALTVTEDANLSISGLRVADIDAASGIVSVTLSVKHGTVTVLDTVRNGVTAAAMTGNGTASVTLTGTLAQINLTLARLDAVVYQGDANFSGTDTLTMRTNDGGNTGTGGAKTDTDTVTIKVKPVNDAPIFANPGDGQVDTDFGFWDSGRTVTVQPDGKILVSGTSNGGFVLARYNADGSLDTSFSGDGKLITDFGQTVTVQSDGKILVTGYVTNGTNNDLALERYNADGSLDTSFGTDGKVTTAVGSSSYGSSVTVQSDGKILVSGYGSDGTNYGFALVRYNADGSLDTSFSGDGKVTTDLGSAHETGASVTVQPDGKILVTGNSNSNDGTHYGLGLVRYNADGSLDTSFSSDGKLMVDFGFSWSQTSSVTVQPDGKILVVGFTSNATGSNDFGFARYNANGSLDTSFSGDGKAFVTNVNSAFVSGYSINVQPDGKILVAGYVSNGSAGGGVSSSGGSVSYNFGLARYNADGSLDTSFSGDGKVTTDTGFKHLYGYSTTVQPDGKIVVIGTREHAGTGADFQVLRYNADGSVDTSFNTVNTLGGTVNFTEGGTPVVLDADVIVTDAELDALRGGRGNYDGASLTIERIGGASAQDVFSASGTLGALTEGTSLKVGRTTIGTVTGNADGTLVLTFNSNATTALVSQALRQIAYANNSDAPPDSVQLGWTFSDGNTTGAQGTGGEKFATGSVTVNITPVNDAPTGTDATVMVPQDGTKTLTAADFGFADVKDSPANTLAAVKISTLPASGELRFNGVAITAAQIEAGYEVSAADLAAGKLTFAPESNPNGTGYATSFTFQVRDNGGTASGGVDLDPSANTITVNVTPVNDVPAAVADSVTLAEDSGVKVIDVLANDSDLDGDTLTVTAVTQPAQGGSVAINADGTLSFTPDANFNGATSFTYTVSDGHGGNATATVTVNVTPVNDAPVAVADSVTLAEDSGVKIIDVLANDSDLNGDTLTVTAVTQPTEGGSVAINEDGTLSFTPDANFNGTTSFTYTVSDGHGGSATATVTVNVTPVNDAPVAVADSVTLAEDSGVKIIDVLANDSDLNGDTLTVTAVTQPTEGGSVAINEDGTLSFTPDANFNGTTSFTYTVSDGHGGSATATVTVNVTPVNDAPVAVADSVTLAEDSGVKVIDVLANDSDLNGDTLTVTAVTQPAQGGSVDINADGTLSFTPDANFNGTTSFTYTVSDGHGGNATATVTVNVTPVNDAPVAVADSVTLAEDSGVKVIDVLANDSDLNGDTLTVTAVTQPAQGGSVDINADGTLSFTPDANFNGATSFTYTVSDGHGGNATATVTVNVTPVNDAPTGTDATVMVPQDGTKTLTAADFGFTDEKDSPANTLAAVKISTLPASGELRFNGVAITAAQIEAGYEVSAADLAAGKLTFAPESNPNGTGYATSFTFQVRDNGGTANSGVDLDQDANVITIDVASVDRPLSVTSPTVSEGSPYAVFTVTGKPGQLVKLELTSGTATVGTDTGDTLQYFDGTDWVDYAAGTNVAIPAGGTTLLVRVAVTGDNVYEGPETFTLKATNASGTPATGTATIRDDGQGDVYPDNTTGETDPNAAADDDRPLSVTSPTVSEGSPYAVFTVTGKPGQLVKLELTSGTATVGTDTGDTLQYFDGTDWVDYAAGTNVAIPAGGTTLLVRVAVTGDNVYEGPETFTLKATNASGTPATGTATIRDDGQGDVYPDNTTGETDPNAAADDDRPLSVTSPTVSEGSPYAVFTVTGKPGQLVKLELTSGTATVGTDTGDTLQYFDGTDWVDYAAGTNVAIPAGGTTLLVRVAVTGDSVYEGPETFTLKATNASGTPATGTATMVDDGSSTNVFDGGNHTGIPTQGRADDDRPQPVLPPEVPPVTPAQPPQVAPLNPFDRPELEPFTSTLELEPLLTRHHFEVPLGEILTRSAGFQVAVIEESVAKLTLFRGVTDQFVEMNRDSRFSLPYDAFIHTRSDATVLLEAKLLDGSKLPKWVEFDGRSGNFRLSPPKGFTGEFQVKITARDNQGNEAVSTFRLFVGDAKHKGGGRHSMSEQIKLAANRSSPWGDIARTQDAMLQAQRQQMSAQRLKA